MLRTDAQPGERTPQRTRPADIVRPPTAMVSRSPCNCGGACATCSGELDHESASGQIVMQRASAMPLHVMRSSLRRLQGSAGNRAAAELASQRTTAHRSGQPSGTKVSRQSAPSRDEHAAFVLDDETTNLVEGRSLAPKNLFHTTTKAAFVDRLKSLKQVSPKVTSIHIISHGTVDITPKDEERGVVFFAGENPTRVRLSDLAKEVAAGLGGGLTPAPTISFRGCRVGNAQASLEEFRKAVGGSTASGTDCKTAVQPLGAPVTLGMKCTHGGGPEQTIKQEITAREHLTAFKGNVNTKCGLSLTDAQVEADFDDELRAAIDANYQSVEMFNIKRDRRDCIVPLEKGQRHNTSFPIVKKAYFDNSGQLVSTYTLNTSGLNPFPGPCFKDLDASSKTCQLISVPGTPSPNKPGGKQSCLPADVPNVVFATADRPASQFGIGPPPASAQQLTGLRRGDGLAFGTFDRRGRVTELQNLLNEQVGSGLSADGMFGGGTADALARFQRSVGLAETNEVDLATADALSGSAPIPTTSSDLVGLQRGDGLVFGTFGRRPRVTKLQTLLTSWGFATKADGMWGPLTQGVFNQFQLSRALPATEIVDPSTAEALEGRTAPPEICITTDAETV